MQLRETKAWKALKAHHDAMNGFDLRHAFAQDPQRFQRFSLCHKELLLDYSKHYITEQTKDLLLALADELNLNKHINALMTGEPVNDSEHRPALHTALRDASQVASRAILDTLKQDKAQFAKLVESFSHEAVTDVVHLGIGGSHLGPQLVCEALSAFRQKDFNLHFITSLDAEPLETLLHTLNPETTRFIIVSKSFGTQETLAHAQHAKAWLQKTLPQGWPQHCVAITHATQKALDFGLLPEQCLSMPIWVGGRYSLWSNAGFVIALFLGLDNFNKLLQGAANLDRHFREQALQENMPVLLGLLSFWYTQFYAYQTHGIFPYTEKLKGLPAYLQQLCMESNGKSMTQRGQHIDYPTCPIIWGGLGNNGQHAFFQQLHQGTTITPCDFILVKKPGHNLQDQHNKLLQNALSQSLALMEGKSQQQAYAALKAKGLGNKEAQHLASQQEIPGNRPSTTLVLSALTPDNLGALLALYEHKTFVESVLWQINAFDQWGVELGKAICQQLASTKTDGLDSSTQGLLTHLGIAYPGKGTV